MRVKELLKLGKEFFKTNEGKILIGLQITGVISTGVTAGVATPGYLKAREEKEKEVNDKLAWSEEIVIFAKSYWPALLSGALTIGNILLKNKLDTEEKVALTAACAVSENALREYKEAAVKTVGEKKKKEIDDTYVKDRCKNDIPDKGTVDAYLAARGNRVMVHDVVFGGWSVVNYDDLFSEERVINERVRMGDVVYLNDLRFDLNLEDLHDSVGLTRGFESTMIIEITPTRNPIDETWAAYNIMYDLNWYADYK